MFYNQLTISFCSRNYVIPSRLQESQIYQDNLNGFTAIEELEEINNQEDEDNNNIEFFEIGSSLDGQEEKRDGSAMVPILPWKGTLKKSSSSANLNE